MALTSKPITASNYTLVVGDKGKLLACSNMGGVTITDFPNTPPQGPIPSDYDFFVKAIVGSVTFSPAAGQVDGQASRVLAEGEYARFAWVSGGWQSCT